MSSALKILATGYAMDGWGSNSGKDKIFLFTASIPALGTTQPPIQWVPATIPLGVKQPELDSKHSPPSSPEVKNGGFIHLCYNRQHNKQCADTLNQRQQMLAFVSLV
jgi:hypothetical protein